jgi:DNA-binding response OmpR family regulator
VLIVEDDPMAAMDMEAIARGAGYEVQGPVNSIEAALQLIATAQPGTAVLDIALGAESCVPVAEELQRRRVPFVFVSGYSADVLPQPLRSRPFLRKPFAPEALRRILASLL